MDASANAIDVYSSDDENTQQCVLYTGVSMFQSEDEHENEGLDQDEMDQVHQEYRARIERQQRDFQGLAEHNALVGIQLELGSPWLVVDTEG